MADLPYSFEPAPGYNKYKVTAMLRDYLGMLMEQPENRETIEQILKLIDGYTDQLRKLRTKNQVDGYFDVNTEILASAILNVDEAGPLEKVLLSALDKTSNM